MRLARAALLCAIASAACFREDPSPEGDTDVASTGGSATTSDGSGEAEESTSACECSVGACIEGMCVPVGCGDGVVGDDEQCDEGPDNDQSGACKIDCTLQVCGDGQLGGAESCDDANLDAGDGCDAACVLESCGDGDVDDGEACDDGDRVQGNGCNNDCQPSGAITWEHLVAGNAGGADSAFDLAIYPDDGSIVVVGTVIDEGTTAAAFWQALDPNGAVLYTPPTSTSPEGGAWLFGVVCDPPLCTAIGHQFHPNSLYSVIGRLFAPDGHPDQTTEIANAAMTGRVAYDLALAPSGVDIVGFSQSAVGQQDGILATLDGTLALTNTYTLLPGPPFGVLRKLVRRGDRRVIVGWSLAENLATTDAYLLRVEADGTVASTTNVTGSAFNLALSVAIDDDNSAIVGGFKSDAFQMMGPGAAILRRYADNGGLVWQMDGSYGGDTARFDDVAIAPGGDIVAVGGVRSMATGMDVLVTRHTPGGMERWRKVIDDPGFDLVSGVAIDPDSEAIYVAGRRSLEGTEDVWVARFTP